MISEDTDRRMRCGTFIDCISLMPDVILCLYLKKKNVITGFKRKKEHMKAERKENRLLMPDLYIYI